VASGGHNTRMRDRLLGKDCHDRGSRMRILMEKTNRGKRSQVMLNEGESLRAKSKDVAP